MTEPISHLDPFFKALASETRQRILFHVMADGRERTVGQIAEAAELGQSTTSEHLAVLKRGGLVESRREGKEVYYRPDRARIVATLRQLTDLLSNCCPE
jgi:DNA-binding transcriptional ArsR family regulator